ncbi:MAG: hypothetical protein DIU60_015460 [Actinomycetes bacterium]|jgi:hypothetical protein
MARILLIAAALVVGFFVLGAVLGFLFNVLKVAVIIGIVILAVAAACRLFAGAERCRR